MDTFAIVGGGLAAAKATEGLRDGGFEGRIVLVGTERHLPYERPPLSKGYLLGDEELEKAFVHTPSWYDERDIDLRLGTAGTRIDLDAHTLATDDRECVHYASLHLWVRERSSGQDGAASMVQGSAEVTVRAPAA